jgi:hypothetical protein
MGVWEDRSEIALFISRLDGFAKMAGAEMGHSTLCLSAYAETSRGSLFFLVLREVDVCHAIISPRRWLSLA